MRAVLGMALAVLLASAGDGWAHGMRTAYLELVEREDGAVLATLRMTFPDAGLRVRFAEDCAVTGDATAGTQNQRTFFLRCPAGLAGLRVALAGLGPVLSEAVVRAVRRDGSTTSHVLTAAAPAWVVPVADTWWAVGAQYVRLGVMHILEGADHLLFLLGLVLYVRRLRAILVTETAFTLSHSVSFSATALGLIHVSAPAAEACIALSLILVALDVTDGQPVAEAAWQGPLIALVFGLVHGLGFAGALSEVGLPDRAVASALVGFGLGVEIGQVAFLVVVVVGLWLLRRVAATLVAPVTMAGGYLIGITGAFWLFQRLWVCFT